VRWYHSDISVHISDHPKILGYEVYFRRTPDESRDTAVVPSELESKIVKHAVAELVSIVYGESMLYSVLGDLSIFVQADSLLIINEQLCSREGIEIYETLEFFLVTFQAVADNIVLVLCTAVVFFGHEPKLWISSALSI